MAQASADVIRTFKPEIPAVTVSPVGANSVRVEMHLPRPIGGVEETVGFSVVIPADDRHLYALIAEAARRAMQLLEPLSENGLLSGNTPHQ